VPEVVHINKVKAVEEDAPKMTKKKHKHRKKKVKKKAAKDVTEAEDHPILEN
jgi:hypothetical protein